MAANIPEPDYDTLTQIAQGTHDAVASALAQMGGSGFITEGIAQGIGGLMFVIGFITLVFMEGLLAIGSWLATSFLSLLDNAKQDNQDELNKLMSTSLQELMGVNIDPGQLASGSGQGASMDLNQQVGDSIVKMFEDQFGGNSVVDPQQGARNARTFLGWSVNFAVSEGFTSILAEMCSLGFLKEIKELPDAIRQAMGMGRLNRVALTPLINAAVTQPYTRYCNNLFRPNKLSEGQLIRALHSGDLDENSVNQQLSELGYSDDLIDFLKTDFSVKLGISDLMILLENGDIQEQDVINNLTLAGMPNDQAKLLIQAWRELKAQAHYDTLKNEVATSFVNGFIDEGTYNGFLDKIPMSDQEDAAFRMLIGFRQETPRKTASFADLKAAIVANILTPDALDAWMTTQGYDQIAQQVMTWQVFTAIDSAEKKVEYAQYKVDALKAKKKPIPPWLEDAAKPVK